MYEPRRYRRKMISARFHSFRIAERESDLMIGISKPDYTDEIPKTIQQELSGLRKNLEQYIEEKPDFLHKLESVQYEPDDNGIIKKMKEHTGKFGIGPMASVAGMISEEIGKLIITKFQPEELYIENGGDVFIKINRDLVLAIDAGKNKLFENLGVRLTSDHSPLGICTSSGIFGHSFSKGKADSVTVISQSAYLSDSMATALANQVQNSNDINMVLEQVNDEKISVIVIKDEKIGFKGNVNLELMKSIHS